jgi:hypothetical protein
MTATGYSVAAMGVKRLRSQVAGRLEEWHSVSNLDGFARAMRKTLEFQSLRAAIFGCENRPIVSSDHEPPLSSLGCGQAGRAIQWLWPPPVRYD